MPQNCVIESLESNDLSPVLSVVIANLEEDAMEAKWFQRESDSTISKKFADKIADKPRIRVQLVLKREW